MAAPRGKRVIWSPVEDPLFLVGGTDLKLYEWCPDATDDDHEYGHYIGGLPDMVHMRSFDWGHHQEFRDMVAIGFTTGKAVLTRLQYFDLVNQPKGGGRLLSRTPSSTSLVGTSPSSTGIHVVAEFMPRHMRACTSVAFCPTEPRLLATGYDKVRNDFGIMIWDAELAVRNTSTVSVVGDTAEASTGYSRAGTLSSRIGDGIRASLASAYPSGMETIDFRKASISEMADVTNRAGPPTSDGASMKPVLQYGSSEGVSALTWLYQSPPVLLAGMGVKWIRAYDLRIASSTSPSWAIATKAIQGICADPFHPERFASFGDDNVIRIWDSRNTAEPAAVLVTDFRYGISQISWCPSRHGCLAASGRDLSALKIWNIQESPKKTQVSTTLRKERQAHQSHMSQNLHRSQPNSPPEDSTSYSPGLSGDAPTTDGATSDSNQSNVEGNVKASSAPPNAEQSDVVAPSSILNLKDAAKEYEGASLPIAWKSVIVQHSSRPSQGFAWIPHSITNDFSYSFVSGLWTKDATIDVINIPATLYASFAPTGTVTAAGGRDIRVYSGALMQPKPSLRHWDSVATTTSLLGELSDTSQETKTSDSLLRRRDYQPDISLTMRERAERGYSMDITKNTTILLNNDRDLVPLWEWLEHIKQHALRNMLRLDGIDYTILGIQAIIQNMMANAMSSRKPWDVPMSSSDRGAENEPAAFVSFTNHHRNVALLMCGWSFYASDVNKEEMLEQSLQELVTNGQYEKAAGLALFHSSNPARAIDVLNASKDERLKLVATAFAAYFSAPATSSAKLWQDMCRSLSAELRDPYLRAMFALIASNGDWQVVLQERGLSIKDRIGVALRFLNDDELLAFINKLTNKMVLMGDINGLILTGLTPAGADLMENYLNRTADVQTAALVFTMVVPGRFGDQRVDEWCETYRVLLDRWQFYHVRANFDIMRHRHLQGYPFAGATPHPSTTYNTTVAPQIYVRCNFCNQPVVNGLYATPTRKPGAPFPNAPGGLPMAGGGQGNPIAVLGFKQKAKITSCPNCRKPLPRCALCLLHMGTPAESPQYFSRRDKSAPSSEFNGFDTWFTWCQTCRHGGHALHLMQWFENHNDCPVSECKCQYSVLAEYEDSFCLETFGDLIEAHHECDPKGTRGFIIARVQTWDVRQPGKAFYSYYNAYHLNKILFQTQVYLGKKLIHRLHVLNPLTNTDIIGDVQYFVVKAKDQSPSETLLEDGKDTHNADDHPNIIATSLADDGGRDGEAGETDTVSPLRMAGGVIRKRKSVVARSVPSIITSPATLRQSPTKGRVDLPAPSPAVRDIDAGKVQSWTMVAPSVTEITEEEATGPGPQPRKFSIKTLGLKSPYVSANPSSPVRPMSAYPVLESSRHPGEFIINIPPSPRSPISGAAFDFPSGGRGGLPERRGTSLDIRVVAKPPQGMVQMRIHRRNGNRAQVPPGSVTRFAKPVSADEMPQVSPPTPERRRRMFSYVNTMATAGSTTSFETWLKIAKEEHKNSPRSPQKEVDGLRMSLTRALEAPSDSTAALLNDSTDQVPLSASTDESSSDEPVITFDAILFATDTDYLESSKIRAVFRQNALTPEDVKHFEMPEYTGQAESPPPPIIVIDDSALCEWCYPSSSRLATMPPFMRLFHRSKCWFLLVVVAISLFCFIFFTLKAGDE
ncbi:hypothetical protein HDU85_004191 [Gaertneriomyces sp. JEL0708]|nr:hypothetical protein HDU85_004191 [Gaertneriomyces sp. JEL0708]